MEQYMDIIGYGLILLGLVVAIVPVWLQTQYNIRLRWIFVLGSVGIMMVLVGMAIGERNVRPIIYGY
jgi:hypothetical protein